MVDKSHATWVEELIGMFITGPCRDCNSTDATLAECRKLRLPAPVFNILSDRRGMLPLPQSISFPFLCLGTRCLTGCIGGRTAWTSTVTIQGHNIPARNWYDGQFLNNAKEDAAEVALIKMRNPSLTAQSSRSQGRQSTAGWVR